MNVLGVDAAWTRTQPSGVALVSRGVLGWRCVAVAPSYQQFVELSQGTPVNWDQRPTGSAPDPAALIAAATALAGAPPDLVAVDMPLARTPITRRRAADDAVSRAFGGQGCGTHTPSAERPGPISETLREGLANLGYPLATSAVPVGTPSHVLEVYPHPALLRLVNAAYRVPYKVAKVRAYRKPDESVQDGWRNLRAQWRLVLAALSAHVHDLPAPLLEAANDESARASRLKRFEDALDALICAWVGARFLEGSAVAYGDEDAAVWCPA